MTATKDLFAVVRAASELTDSVTVGFSGGKDSVVTLELCVRHFKKVSAFFQYVAPGLSFQETYLRAVERRYGLTIWRVPHWTLGQMLATSTYRPGAAGDDENVAIVTLPDMEAWLRQKYGSRWFATGQKKNDSLERRGMISAVGGIDFKTRRFYPCAEWSNRQVFAYIRQNNLLLPQIYDELGASFNSEQPEHLAWLRRRFPGDWDKLARYYPYIEARVARKETYGI